ncbi:MAG: hypothetical protein PHT40_02765 [Patescibacteria group bacterium]|nr:hypothetical protein [Patescibacteria group bacterium]
MDHQIGQLMLKAENASSQMEVFSADDELAKESNLGRFFAILEISSREKKAKKAALQIIEMVKKDYYDSPTSDPENSLEEVCQNLNQQLPEIIENPKIWLPKFNIFIGAIKDEKICLSSFGRFKAFLARDNKLNAIIPEEERNLKNKSLKIMSHLIVGELKPGDSLIFSTVSLFDFFAREKIKKTIQTLNPEQSTEYFKNLLLENNGPVSFGALILKIQSAPAAEEIPSYKPLSEFYSTKDSMDNLINMERKTTKIMTTSFWPGIKNSLAKLKKTPLAKAKKDLKIDEQPKVALASLKTRVSSWRGLLPLPAAKKIKVNLGDGWQKITSFFKSFQKLNRRTKIAGYAIVALLILFVISLPLAGSYQRQRAANKKFDEQVTAVEDKIAKAEAELIYKNEAGAAANLKEAQMAFLNLPREKTSWQKEVDVLSQKIQGVADRVYHIFRETAAGLIDFKQIGTAEIKNMVKTGDYLFALSANGALYQINPGDKSYQPVELNGLTPTVARSFNKDNLILSSADNKIFTYNLAQKTFNSKKLTFDEAPLDWYIYADKIYALTENKILKISQPLSEAPTIIDWYNDKPEYLTGAKQIIVDGDVWLTDGGIKRFYRGKKTTFDLTKIDRGLSDSLEIYTENEWNNLYILDKKNSRLLVASKSGLVERQFVTEKLLGAKNLIISDKQEKAWLTNGAEIIEIDLSKR